MWVLDRDSEEQNRKGKGMSRTRKLSETKKRMSAWYARWPDSPCIKFDFITLRGSRIGGQMKLTPEQSKQLIDVLFPEGVIRAATK